MWEIFRKVVGKTCKNAKKVIGKTCFPLPHYMVFLLTDIG